MVLLALESDFACTSLSGHSARKCSVLDLVCCYKLPGDGEQDLWRYWPPEHCIKQGYDKSMGDYCPARSGLREEWSSDISVSCTPPKSSNVQYGNTKFSKISDHCHLPESPLMEQIALCFFYYSSGLWAFCQVVIFLTHVLATKIWSYDVLDPLYIMHILGFITPNFLPNCLMIISALAIFQASICLEVGSGKLLFDYVLKHSCHEMWMFWVHVCISLAACNIAFL